MRFHGTAMPESGRIPSAAPATGDRQPNLIDHLKAQNRLGAARQVWESALCAQVDPELFFPELGQPATKALTICAACSVRLICLEVFGDIVSDGIVGGLTARDRRALRTARRNGAAA
jgi:hypothetical protein